MCRFLSATDLQSTGERERTKSELKLKAQVEKKRSLDPVLKRGTDKDLFLRKLSISKRDLENFLIQHLAVFLTRKHLAIFKIKDT